MISHVVDGIFIGDWQDAVVLFKARSFDSKDWTQKFVIVSMATDTPFGENGDFKAHMVDGADAGNEAQLKRARKMIYDAVSSGLPVLVHCAVGASRSPTAVIAYLMKYKNMDYDAAFNLVRAARPIANPAQALVELVKSLGD